MSVAHWPANKPHIHSATFNQKSLSRPDPGQGRAATDSDACANSHFMATPGHQSLSLPCIPYMAYRRHRPRSTLARRSQRLTFLLSLQWGSPMGRLMDQAPWTTDRGSWEHRTMCRCHPTTGTTPARRLLSPLSHQIPKWSPQRPMIT